MSEACSTPIIGAGSRAGSSHTVIDVDDMDSGLHSGHLATRASLSSLGVSIVRKLENYFLISICGIIFDKFLLVSLFLIFFNYLFILFAP